jgi:ribokinase
MRLHIVGCTVVDIILPRVTKLPAWPDHTEFTPSNLVMLPDGPILTLGGNGGNAAYVAAKCGAAVTLHTELGQDALGTMARGWLSDVGCDVRVGSHAESTGINVSAVNARHQRATFFHPGTTVGMPVFPSREETPGFLLVCGWPHPPLKTLATKFRTVRRRGTFTAMDVGPLLGRAWSLESLSAVLASLDLLLCNEYELLRISQTADLEAAFAKLRGVFHGHAVIKLGPRGALWLPAGSDRTHSVAGCRVRTVNTVGAGDSFNGALLAALGEKREFEPAIRIACEVAAGVVSSRKGVLGASDSAFQSIRAMR